MSVLTPEVAKHLGAGHLGHLTTINPDGSPHTTVVWISVEGEDIVSAHLTDNYVKLRNIRRDPRFALSLEFGTANEDGIHHYLVAEGTAQITPGGAPEILQREAHIYIGPDAVFPGPDAPGGFVLRMRPSRIRGLLPWD